MTTNTPRTDARVVTGCVTKPDGWHTSPDEEWVRAEPEDVRAGTIEECIAVLARFKIEPTTYPLVPSELRANERIDTFISAMRSALALPAAKQSGERDARRYGIARTLMSDGTLGDIEIDSPEAFDAAMDAMLQGSSVPAAKQSGERDARRVSIHGMYDMHLFHRIEGATVDEVIANWRTHNRELQPATVGGHKVDDMGPSSLCPAIVLAGTKDLRRVGPMVFPSHTDRAACDEVALRAWRDALLADPDITRLLQANDRE